MQVWHSYVLHFFFYDCHNGTEPIVELFPGFILFFFTSRRRHTRYGRDWSSDVCSSDLQIKTGRVRPALPYNNVFGNLIWFLRRNSEEPSQWRKTTTILIWPGASCSSSEAAIIGTCIKTSLGRLGQSGCKRCGTFLIVWRSCRRGLKLCRRSCGCSYRNGIRKAAPRQGQ